MTTAQNSVTIDCDLTYEEWAAIVSVGETYLEYFIPMGEEDHPMVVNAKSATEKMRTAPKVMS